MVTYSDGIGGAGPTPGGTDAVTITATETGGVTTSLSTHITFSNSNGADAAPTLTLNAPASATDIVIAGSAQVVDPGLTLAGGTMTAASVVVQNFQAGDVLGYTNAGSLTGSFSTSTGVLTVTGNGTTAQYQSFLQGVTFGTTSAVTTPRSISFVAGSGLYDSANGHFYEYIPSAGLTWDDAEVAASQQTLYGMQGYLATVTSASENSFIQTKLTSTGWMGASDAPLSPTNSTDTSSLAIGHWHWVTGPEGLTVGTDGLPGSYFFQETAGAGSDRPWPSAGGGGVDVNGNYESFNPGEPNDSTGESYAEYYQDGSWNDLPDGANLPGYVVEFGGMPTDPTLNFTANATVDVTAVTVSQPLLAAASDSGSSSSDGVTRNTTATFTGTATANALVTLYVGSTVLASGSADSGGAWSIVTSLVQGAYVVTAKATFGGVTSSASAATNVTIDTTDPTVAIGAIGPITVGDAAGGTSGTTPTISGTVSDFSPAGMTVVVTTDGVSHAATVTGGVLELHRADGAVARPAQRDRCRDRSRRQCLPPWPDDHAGRGCAANRR